MKKWNDIQSDFHPDGSLRDIYIQNTNEDIWNKFIALIKSSKYDVEFNHDGIIDFPQNLKVIKKMQEENPTTLRIFLDKGMQVNCHFFIESQIELDIDPANISGEDSYQKLLNFMNFLSKNLKKDVILTPENEEGFEILKIKG